MTATYSELLESLRTAHDRDATARESGAGFKTPWKLAERIAFLKRVRAAGGRQLLELGAGTGHDSLFFKEQGREVVAIDLSPRTVELCYFQSLAVRRTAQSSSDQ